VRGYRPNTTLISQDQIAFEQTGRFTRNKLSMFHPLASDTCIHHYCRRTITTFNARAIVYVIKGFRVLAGNIDRSRMAQINAALLRL